MKYIVVIPARLNSSRLPNKLLLKIKGKTILEHVYDIALKAVPRKNIVIATPDQKILDLCRSIKARYVKTSHQCKTGTDRVCEVSKKIKCDYYINIQADEIFLDKNSILKIINYLKKNKNVNVVNCYNEIKNIEEFRDTSIIKVIFNSFQELLYMSRAGIPGSKKKLFKKGYKQVCVYGFSLHALRVFESKRKTFFEEIEDIEILRFLEKGLKVNMIKVSGSEVSIDTLRDYKIAKKILE